MTPLPVPRKIWGLWLQGWDSAPDIVRACRASWSLQNPYWTANFLSAADLPDFFPATSPLRGLDAARIPPAAFSDIVRNELLARHGGVWVDATTYCLRPLDGWLGHAAVSGFFAFSGVVSLGSGLFLGRGLLLGFRCFFGVVSQKLFLGDGLVGGHGHVPLRPLGPIARHDLVHIADCRTASAAPAADDSPTAAINVGRATAAAPTLGLHRGTSHHHGCQGETKHKQLLHFSSLVPTWEN